MYISAVDSYAHWQQNKDRKLNFQGADEAELEAALKASMAEWEKQEGDDQPMVGQVLNGKQQEDKKPVEKFGGAGVALGGGGGPSSSYQAPKVSDEEMALMMEYENDPEMLQAMLSSMREAKLSSIEIKPEPGAGVDAALVCTVQFKGPSGQKLIRKFFKSCTVQDLINFYKH